MIKFNKMTLFMLMVLSVYQVSASATRILHDKELQQDIAKKGQQALDRTLQAGQQVGEVSVNMFQDYESTVLGIKDPRAKAMYVGLKMQNKLYPGAAENFKKQADTSSSPFYYRAGLVSFIAGSTLLAILPFSNDKTTLLAGSTLCLATSLGCYYKSRSDLIALKKNVIKPSCVVKN